MAENLVARMFYYCEHEISTLEVPVNVLQTLVF